MNSVYVLTRYEEGYSEILGVFSSFLKAKREAEKVASSSELKWNDDEGGICLGTDTYGTFQDSYGIVSMEIQ